jgi:16S rRNA (guanine966-N2)-methyltransferase
MANDRPTTKIIAGKYKGKILDLPSLDVTRSSKAMLKESLFNVLQFDIIDKLFIESFADRSSYQILLKNCKAVDMEKCQTVQADTFVQTPLILDFLVNSNDEIVLYIDPPFDYRDGMDDVYTKSFDMIKNIELDNIFIIVFEHVSSLEMPKILGKFSLIKTKTFGKSALSYYSYTQE